MSLLFYVNCPKIRFNANVELPQFMQCTKTSESKIGVFDSFGCAAFLSVMPVISCDAI